MEPKLSTILCYQSPREKRRRKLSKVPGQISKSTNDIGDSLKSASATKRARAYRPGNRYGNVNGLLKRSVSDIGDTRDSVATSALFSCARNSAVFQCENETNETANRSGITNNTPIQRSDKKRAFLHKTTSCREIGGACDEKTEDAGPDARILHLTGPSPRSCYVRRHVAELITYKRHSARECRVKTISNETKHITTLTSNPNNAVTFGAEKKRHRRDTERGGMIFDIVTKDMRRMHLRPMHLKDPRTMLMCLENYLDIKTD